MAENTKIEWAHHTLNYWIGCTEVSPECDHCYARTLAGRYGWAKWGNDEPRKHTVDSTRRQIFKWDRKAQEAGEVHRVFINSLSDTLDPFAPNEWRAEIVQAARETPNLNHLILTKRPQNLTSLLSNRPDNIWIGTTVGTRKSLARIKYLTAATAKVRFLSIEPLLEDLGELDLAGIHWVIVGGESGHTARPMHPDWARSIRDQCIAQGVPFLFKQWGEWLPFEETAQPPFYRNCATGEEFDGHGMNFFDEVLEAGKFQGARWMDAHDAVAYNHQSGDWDCSYLHAGKKKAGRLLDGRTWDELPEVTR